MKVGRRAESPPGGPTQFVAGELLCRAFYEEVVAPVVGMPHAAGLLGPGSDVLGYDTERSTDHDWGPRCTVFVPGPAVEAVRERVVNSLPTSYRGWPLAVGRDGEPPAPQVHVVSSSSWLSRQVGVSDLDRLSVVDWLLMPQQRLLGITQGAVFADPDQVLTRLRRRLAWYPEPVHWWLVACQWRRLAQEEPLVQRAAEVDDDLGSRVIAARLVRDCMRLALLLERQYAPYSKWLGTAFDRLQHVDELPAYLDEALRARGHRQRESSLGAAYQALASRFNDQAGCSLDTSLRPFFDRPARVLAADRFVAAALERVSDRELATWPLVGAVDQLLDSTDALTDPHLPSMRSYYLSLDPGGQRAGEITP